MRAQPWVDQPAGAMKSHLQLFIEIAFAKGFGA
jgi:hypothetical protein